MSFFKGMFGGSGSGSGHNNNQQQPQPTPDQHQQQSFPTNPSPPPFTRPQPAAGLVPSTAGIGRPDAAALARARQSRQAALAAAAFGSAVPQPAMAGGHITQLHNQYGAPHGAYTPGGGDGGGGDMFDMFGGLDVKADTAPGHPTIPNSVSFGGGGPAPRDDDVNNEEPSGFSFIDDSQSVDPEIASVTTANGGYVFDATTAVTTDSGMGGESGFSFISEDSGATDSAVSAFDYGSSSQTYDAMPASSSRLDNAKSFLDRSLSIFWQEWRQLTATESQLKQDEVQLQLGIRRDTAAMRETEEKQGAAVAAEEYERADAFNAELDRLKHSIESAQERMKRAKAEIQQKEAQKQAAVARALSFLKDSESQLQSISDERQSELQSFISTQTSALIEKDSAINSDLERIKTSLSATQSDLDEIDSQNIAIDQSLDKETQPFLQEKDNLISAMSTLEMDLEELKRQVAVKEREIAENREKQLQAERAVDLVNVKFTQQRAAVAEKKARIDSLRSRDVSEQHTIEERARRVDEEIERAKVQERAARVTLHDIAESLAHTRYLTSLLDKESQERADFINALNEDESKIADYRSELENYESNLASVRLELATVEQSVEHHNQNIATINTKIPAMEAEKNAAVTARDFKKAAAASKAVKDAQQSKADSEAAIEELRQKINTFTDTLSSADTRKGEIAEAMLKLEDECDRKRLHFLIVREQKLTNRQSRVTQLLQRAYEHVNNDSAANQNYLDHLQKEVEAVDVELKWTQVEIRELKTKHSDWSTNNISASASELEDESESVVVNHVDDPSLFDAVKKGSVSVSVNGSNGQSFGFPVIQSPAQAAKVLPSHSQALFGATSKSYTQEDAESIQSQLQSRRDALADNENKLSTAVEAENFEEADELGGAIEQDKATIEQLEQELAKIEEFLTANQDDASNEEAAAEAS